MPQVNNSPSIDDPSSHRLHLNGVCLVPLQADFHLDRHSRWVIELLQSMYHDGNVGSLSNIDVITTSRVHFLLDQLLQLSSSTNAAASVTDTITPSIHSWQCAERGRALLEAMELFIPWHRELVQRQQEHPDRPIRIKRPLPLPNPDTYSKVLRLYAIKYLHGSKDEYPAPQLCLELLQRMETHGAFPATVVHWNQVLSAYANCKDVDRPIQAAQLVYKLSTLLDSEVEESKSPSSTTATNKKNAIHTSVSYTHLTLPTKA